MPQSIRHRIAGLHSGQLLLLWVAGLVAVPGLLRERASLRARIDDLNRFSIEQYVKSLHPLVGTRTPSEEAVAAAARDSFLVRNGRVVSRWRGEQQVCTAIAGLIMGGLFLVTWVWFGSRQRRRPGEPAAPT
jgi:hypothetical protein